MSNTKLSRTQRLSARVRQLERVLRIVRDGVGIKIHDTEQTTGATFAELIDAVLPKVRS